MLQLICVLGLLVSATAVGNGIAIRSITKSQPEEKKFTTENFLPWISYGVIMFISFGIVLFFTL